MEPHQSSSPLLFFVTIIFIFFAYAPSSLCDDDERFSDCTNSTFDCGSIANIRYPFWGNDRPDYCGLPGFKLECLDGVPQMEIMSQRFQILDIIQTNLRVMTVARMDFLDDPCPEQFENTTLDHPLFDYAPDNANLTLFYACSFPMEIRVSNRFTCLVNGNSNNVSYFVIGPVPTDPNENITKCDISVQVPILGAAVEGLVGDPSTVGEVLKEGFNVVYIPPFDHMCIPCLYSGGQCGYNWSSLEFTCFCRDKPYAVACPTPSPGMKFNSVKIIIGVSAGGTFIIAATIIVCWLKIRSSSGNSEAFWKKKTKSAQNVEEFLRDYGLLVPKRYKYSDIKKMTDSFKNKLGQGGYGGVFKGKLLDSCLVAVKVLSESKGNGEEFINEVASISRTSHVNIVTLLGFCVEGPKRALIYKFMPNGSLEKLIYDEKTIKTHPQLGWERLFQIAVGIARGLEYLHRGCNTRILHFDIKPHNILLDEDFCPKISDFGLAKLCPRKESIISMVGARGTPGYIAPEVFSRNFGEVSHKSDVYSYGMMVLEMVGGRKNIDAGVDNLSEIYFPHWIYNHLHQHRNLGLDRISTDGDEEIARKMIIVGLWCIQTNPYDRPSTSKVLEMLEGDLQSLPFPPKPFISSPSRSPADSPTK